MSVMKEGKKRLMTSMMNWSHESQKQESDSQSWFFRNALSIHTKYLRSLWI